MDRNANRIASRAFNDDADARTRNSGGHVERPGRRRAARAAAKAARKADRRWVERSQVST